MILAVDIGNSDVVIGLYRKDKWEFVWRTPSKIQRESWEFATFVKNKLSEAEASPENIEKVVLSSVVPKLTPVIQFSLTSIFHEKLLIVGPTIYPHLPVSMRNPNEIGTDLVANAMAAYTHCQSACIVVDFGTALTMTILSDKGEILGVAIAPGIQTAVKALFINAAQLPEIPLELPDSVIGKNTIHAIQSGILIGYIGLVKELLQQAKREVNTDCKVFATGGLVHILKPLQKEFDYIDQQLTLNGLRLIALSVG
jgi:type III pantothenate kinase